MNKIVSQLNDYLTSHPIDLGTSGCSTVLNQLYQAYADSHESDPPEIREGFKELDNLLADLPLDDNNTVWNLCCRLCIAYERKAFTDGLKYGTHLSKEVSQ